MLFTLGTRLAVFFWSFQAGPISKEQRKDPQKAARLLSGKYGGFNDPLAMLKMSAFQGELSKYAEFCLNFSC